LNQRKQANRIECGCNWVPVHQGSNNDSVGCNQTLIETVFSDKNLVIKT
jgi:hypothetical protein